MLQSRRVQAALAVVLVLLAVGAGLASRPRDYGPPAADMSAGAASAAQPVVERTLTIGADGPRRVRVPVDREVRLTVEGADDADVVELVGLDRYAQVSPDLPAVFDLLPSRPGSYRIELDASGERVGTLRVDG